jgi:Ca2+-transporting ATPase
MLYYENEPMEKNMTHRNQGLLQTLFLVGRNCQSEYNSGFGNNIRYVISISVCGLSGLLTHVTRTMVFLVLVTSNVFLTLINRSFYYSILPL